MRLELLHERPTFRLFFELPLTHIKFGRIDKLDFFSKTIREELGGKRQTNDHFVLHNGSDGIVGCQILFCIQMTLLV